MNTKATYVLNCIVVVCLYSELSHSSVAIRFGVDVHACICVLAPALAATIQTLVSHDG